MPDRSLHSVEFFQDPEIAIKMLRREWSDINTRNLYGSAFCMVHIGLPDQALGWFPVGLGLSVEDKPTS